MDNIGIRISKTKYYKISVDPNTHKITVALTIDGVTYTGNYTPTKAKN